MEDIEEAIVMLSDIRDMIFQDYDVWSGYTKSDFNKIITLLTKKDNK